MLRNLSVPPPFSLPDSTGAPRSLDELRGDRAFVLLFFRGAFCATSRRDLLAWGDVHERMGWLGAEMAAVSVDPPSELARLKERLELPFALLSDEDFAVSRQYGIYTSDETDAGPQPHGEPGLFVLDNLGRLVFSQVQSGPKGAASPGEAILMLVLMQANNGRYW
jgi:peroxiredoxin